MKKNELNSSQENNSSIYVEQDSQDLQHQSASNSHLRTKATKIQHTLRKHPAYPEQCYSHQAADKPNTTLGDLTKQFVKLIKTQQDQTIDISLAGSMLSVQKRRIYDITNVLEGIGYIVKIGKNKMKWLGATTQQNNDKEMDEVNCQIQRAEDRFKELERAYDLLIDKNKSQFSSTPTLQTLNYITKNDLQCYMAKNKIECALVYEGCEGVVIECAMDQDAQTVQLSIDAPNEKKTKISLIKIKLEGTGQKQVCPVDQRQGPPRKEPKVKEQEDEDQFQLGTIKH